MSTTETQAPADFDVYDPAIQTVRYVIQGEPGSASASRTVTYSDERGTVEYREAFDEANVEELFAEGICLGIQGFDFSTEDNGGPATDAVWTRQA